jgi:Cu/Ag efflux pump CusA
LKKKLPAGYTIEAGGTVEESAKGLRSIALIFPMMIFLILTILMVQLQSFQKMFLVIGSTSCSTLSASALAATTSARRIPSESGALPCRSAYPSSAVDGPTDERSRGTWASPMDGTDERVAEAVA